ncbi:Class II aaRS and biotin synthetase [Venustampulla echinocandica]|uniref:asparagine--tRNA ligase n=1 Tax=Venustampulla echinocandica TaxID=2656787 RepID=A0A370TG87_9HELO|nr:Class II aaRS and biotin synthetase [Venustampulla echinocandica]RDL33910.1 Class II aaRS and biotin synthetase [Venustampulla echinocandica]
MATIRPQLSRCVRQAVCRASNRPFSSSRQQLQLPVPIAHILDKGPADAEDVVINGFVRSIRNQKQRSFASIGDGSSLEPLQALLTPEQAQSLTAGTAVRLSGAWKPSPNPKAQSHELHVTGVDVIGAADPTTFPLQKKYQTPEYLRTIPHLRTRLPFNSTLLRFRSACIAEITLALSRDGYTQTHTPIITSSDCEGAGEVFNVGSTHKAPVGENDDGSFFRSPKYLTVSSQLHLEALAQSVGNVWTLSPTFRAEKSDTARHLSEFYMLEIEMSFVEDMNVVMDAAEKLIQCMTRPLLSSRVGREILASKDPNNPHPDEKRPENLRRRWEGILSGPWPRITYTEAIRLLQSSKRKFDHKPEWGSGLQAEHERYIADKVGVEGSPVFVTHYPRSIKPFYMLPAANNNDTAETVECFDLLLPEVCEVVGGSMREYRVEQLLVSMQSNGLIPPGPLSSISDEQLGELKWYVDLRRWGSVPHGGFGLGFDRLLGYLAGVQNIREIVPFPRWVGRCEC